MAKDLWDNGQVEGQLQLEDLFEMDLPEQMFAVSKIFARAKTQMNLAEFKTFVFCLCNIRWTDKMPNMVYMDKKILAKIVGVNSDPDHLSANLKRSIGELPLHSYIEFANEDADLYDSGVLISRVTMLKNRVRVKFDDEYVKLFSSLEKDYITMWSTDIFRMKSERSIRFYEELRMHSDTRIVNTRGYGVKALKELFDIPKDGKGSYMREKGGFDRVNFERRVIDPLCEDLMRCKMIQLVLQPDGKAYRKVKQGNRVLGYEFSWTVSDRPRIADAKEMPKLQKNIEKNPAVLKIAKDIIAGKEKPKKEVAAKPTGFSNFRQRNTDYDAIQTELERRDFERFRKEEEEKERSSKQEDELPEEIKCMMPSAEEIEYLLTHGEQTELPENEYDPAAVLNPEPYPNDEYEAIQRLNALMMDDEQWQKKGE